MSVANKKTKEVREREGKRTDLMQHTKASTARPAQVSGTMTAASTNTSRSASACVCVVGKNTSNVLS